MRFQSKFLLLLVIAVLLLSQTSVAKAGSAVSKAQLKRALSSISLDLNSANSELQKVNAESDSEINSIELKYIADSETASSQFDSELGSYWLEFEMRLLTSIYEQDMESVYNKYSSQLYEIEKEVEILTLAKNATTHAIKSSVKTWDGVLTAVTFQFNLDSIMFIDNYKNNMDTRRIPLKIITNSSKWSKLGANIAKNYSDRSAISYNKLFGNYFLDDYSLDSTYFGAQSTIEGYAR